MNGIVKYLITPPAAFLIVLCVTGFLSFLFTGLAFKNKKQSEESKEAYACGEDFQQHMIQPDYSQF
ncbi:MAG: hypothetical protein NT060_05210, partial [Candidatus Omnitrophica bacterium]|nr:hypothetical protein [Candidatus Omnitrophota bacterium]